jgi:hypothetical protein
MSLLGYAPSRVAIERHELAINGSVAALRTVIVAVLDHDLRIGLIRDCSRVLAFGDLGDEFGQRPVRVMLADECNAEQLVMQLEVVETNDR